MKNDFNRLFGERLSQLRTNRSMTRAQLAEQSRLSDRFLFDLESGKKGPSAATLLALSQALHVSTDYLLTGKSVLDNPKLDEIISLLSEVSDNSLPYIKMMIEAFFEYTRNQ